MSILGGANVFLVDDQKLEEFKRQHSGDTFLFIDNVSGEELFPLASNRATFLRTQMFRSTEEIWQLLASYIIQLRLVIFQITNKLTDVELRDKLTEIRWTDLGLLTSLVLLSGISRVR